MLGFSMPCLHDVQLLINQVAVGGVIVHLNHASLSLFQLKAGLVILF